MNQPPTHDQLMIYGAYGYTGELIAREAVARGMAPVLAGRNEQKTGALARELGVEARVFDLDKDAISGQLADIDVVIHCAGPFSATAPPMIAACLASQTHYLDITGEIEVFEHLFAQHEAAVAAGVVLCSGAGFDVVPTDCVAARLAEEMPEAQHLALGFDTRSGLSPGTAKTTVEGLAGGGKIRRDGRIETVKLAAQTRRIDFGDGEKAAMTIPWGDVATAFHSTGIPNISVFMPMSPKRIAQVQRLNMIRPVLGFAPVQNFLKKRAGQVQGPDQSTREKRPTYVWGEATDANGHTCTARIKVANGYTVTRDASLALAERLLEHDSAGGAYTPSRLAGWRFVESLPGSQPMTISTS